MDFYTRLPRVPMIKDSRGYIVDQCKDKVVLHFGCVDAGVLEERFASGRLLHSRLATTARELWGFDIDAEGIAFLQSKGVPNLLAGDATHAEDLAPLKNIQFDVIVAGEIVEHLMNPGLFLENLKMLRNSKTELIVTVPSNAGINMWLALFRGYEYVHPDHNYWFSYVTITNLVKKSGYHIKQVMAYSQQLVPFWYRPSQTGIGRWLMSLVKRVIVRVLYRITPFWGDGLIVVSSYEKPLG